MIKLTSILKEMAETDIHFQNILDRFLNGNNLDRANISKEVSGVSHRDEDRLKKDLSELDYEDVIEIEKKLSIQPLEEACWDGYRQVGLKKKGNRTVPNCVRIKEDKKPKIKKAYLTKDAAAMKKEINRVKKLKDDDPSAYRKWDADYADKDKTKKYKTKKSVATTAYEKRFGKKEK